MKRWIPFLKTAPVVAVIRLSGVIATGSRGQLNDASLAPVIEKAFRKGKPKAVALLVNSPGGSPAQSSLIAARIRRLSAEKEIPVTAFVEDVAASGGYWLATAADEIVVDDNSIVGSIGVISAGFGLNEFINRHGIERRVHTAGKSKSWLDPFQPEKPADVKRLKALQGVIHENFITQVKTRRGDRLDDGRELFTGDVWVGAQAVEAGLADQVGHLEPVMQARYGDKVKFTRYGAKRGLLGRIGLQLMGDALAGVEERAEFARFGL
ncbi:MAG TPA: S49 family peptidase [Rhodobacteraceae bacterium]|nr:S49 family peptidase [Paracoccaceae bacterium]